MRNPDCDPVEQQQVQERLDALYEQDGRHDPAHPLHASYTALHLKYTEQGDE